MDYQLSEQFHFTTNHPASHYGIPVLMRHDGIVFGPADDISTPRLRECSAIRPTPPRPMSTIMCAISTGVRMLSYREEDPPDDSPVGAAVARRPTTGALQTAGKLLPQL